MFDTIQAAPPDPILGITEAFQKDPRDGKINLSVGVFKDESGATPVLPSVKAAEQRRLVVGSAAREIAEMPDFVILADGGVPGFDQRRVMRGEIGKGALVQAQDARIGEMRVGGEEDHASRNAASGASFAKAGAGAGMGAGCGQRARASTPAGVNA